MQICGDTQAWRTMWTLVVERLWPPDEMLDVSLTVSSAAAAAAASLDCCNSHHHQRQLHLVTASTVNPCSNNILQFLTGGAGLTCIMVINWLCMCKSIFKNTKLIFTSSYAMVVHGRLKTPKNRNFLGSPSPYILGDTTRPGHVTCVPVWSKSDRRRLRKTLHKQTNRQTNKQTDRQTDRHYENNGHLALNQ